MDLHSNPSEFSGYLWVFVELQNAVWWLHSASFCIHIFYIHMRVPSSAGFGLFPIIDFSVVGIIWVIYFTEDEWVYVSVIS